MDLNQAKDIFPSWVLRLYPNPRSKKSTQRGKGEEEGWIDWFQERRTKLESSIGAGGDEPWRAAS